MSIPQSMAARSFHRSRKRKAGYLTGMALGVFLAVPLHAIVIDDFEHGVKFVTGGGGMDYLRGTVTNGQMVFSGRFPGPTQTYNPYVNYDNVYWPNSLSLTIPQGRTLELRMDLIRSSVDDAFLVLGADGSSGGYMAVVDQNEISLWKYGPANTVFFWTSVPATNYNVTVSLSFTRLTNSLQVTTRVVDKATQQVLFERSVLDGPGSDVGVPVPAPRGMTIFSPDPGPPSLTFIAAWAGVFQWTTVNPAPLEVVADNLEYDLYDLPSLQITNSVLLSWSENTQEEQIVVSADSLASNAVWKPWPQPLFKQHQRLHLTVPLRTNALEQYFKLVPGTQFFDDFSLPQAPFTARECWNACFCGNYSERFDCINTNGSYSITDRGAATDAKVLVLPPGPGIIVGDFAVSVDLLDWPASSAPIFVGIVARASCDAANFPSGTQGVIGGLYINDSGNIGKGRLAVEGQASGPYFTLMRPEDYCLQFSAVGSELRVALYKLRDLSIPVCECKVTDNTGRLCGFVGLWLKWGYAGTVVLDNFIAVGTKP